MHASVRPGAWERRTYLIAREARSQKPEARGQRRVLLASGFWLLASGFFAKPRRWPFRPRVGLNSRARIGMVRVVLVLVLVLVLESNGRERERERERARTADDLSESCPSTQPAGGSLRRLRLPEPLELLPGFGLRLPRRVLVVEDLLEPDPGFVGPAVLDEVVGLREPLEGRLDGAPERDSLVLGPGRGELDRRELGAGPGRLVAVERGRAGDGEDEEQGKDPRARGPARFPRRLGAHALQDLRADLGRGRLDALRVLLGLVRRPHALEVETALLAGLRVFLDAGSRPVVEPVESVGGEVEELVAAHLVLGCGHSARPLGEEARDLVQDAGTPLLDARMGLAYVVGDRTIRLALAEATRDLALLRRELLERGLHPVALLVRRGSLLGRFLPRDEDLAVGIPDEVGVACGALRRRLQVARLTLRDAKEVGAHALLAGVEAIRCAVDGEPDVRHDLIEEVLVGLGEDLRRVGAEDRIVEHDEAIESGEIASPEGDHELAALTLALALIVPTLLAHEIPAPSTSVARHRARPRGAAPGDECEGLLPAARHGRRGRRRGLVLHRPLPELAAGGLRLPHLRGAGRLLVGRERRGRLPGRETQSLILRRRRAESGNDGDLDVLHDLLGHGLVLALGRDGRLPRQLRRGGVVERLQRRVHDAADRGQVLVRLLEGHRLPAGEDLGEPRLDDAERLLDVLGGVLAAHDLESPFR